MASHSCFKDWKVSVDNHKTIYEFIAKTSDKSQPTNDEFFLTIRESLKLKYNVKSITLYGIEVDFDDSTDGKEIDFEINDLEQTINEISKCVINEHIPVWYYGYDSYDEEEYESPIFMYCTGYFILNV